MCTGHIHDWMFSKMFETSQGKAVFFLHGNQVYSTLNIKSLYVLSYLKGHVAGVWNFQRANKNLTIH